MRSKITWATAGVFVAVLAAGCSGPEKKLGRGLNNLTELARGGEWRRTMEQTALWDGASSAYTTGFIRGINRSLVRTAVGAYEVLTFPIPSYDPILYPGNPIMPDASVDPAFPDSYVPNLMADPIWSPDANIGFTGGDVAPYVPASRFRIFDY